MIACPSHWKSPVISLHVQTLGQVQLRMDGEDALPEVNAYNEARLGGATMRMDETRVQPQLLALGVLHAQDCPKPPSIFRTCSIEQSSSWQWDSTSLHWVSGRNLGRSVQIIHISNIRGAASTAPSSWALEGQLRGSQRGGTVARRNWSNALVILMEMNIDWTVC